MVELDWSTFPGVASTTRDDGVGGVCAVGVAPFKCGCCDDRAIVLACAGADGKAVSVQISTADALDLAQRLLALVGQLHGGLVVGRA